jgi:hypothetical protein
MLLRCRPPRAFRTRPGGKGPVMNPSRHSLRILSYGLIGAVIGGVAYGVAQVFISTGPLSLAHGLVLGVTAGFAIGILPAAERDDAEQDRRLARARHGATGPADATWEGQEARDLEAQRQRRRSAQHDRSVS